MSFSQSSETSFDRTDPVAIFEYSGHDARIAPSATRGNLAADESVK